MHRLQVAAGAAELLRNELGDIRALRPQGAQQLSADLEYFTNVLSALGVSPPPVLATWQVRLRSLSLSCLVPQVSCRIQGETTVAWGIPPACCWHTETMEMQ